MDIRTVYASAASVFAALIGFYAVMTLAFFFGENRSEWAFPVLITAMTVLLVWTAVRLWREKDALVLTSVSLVAVCALIGWIVIPAGDWDANFIAVVIVWIASLALLAGLLSAKVRASLRA